MTIFAAPVEVSTQKQLKVSTGASKSVVVLADSGNTKKVWVGGKTETTESGKAFPLAAGASIAIDLSDIGTVWMIAEEGTQKVYYLTNGNVA
jgi:hypothetical protein